MPTPPPSPASLLRRLRREDGGFTLVELLLATSLTLVVAAAILVLLQTSLSSSAASTRRAIATTEATSATHRITHDLRVATQAVVQSSQVLDVVTWQRPASGTGALAPTQIRFDCSTGNVCVRYRCTGAVISGNSCPGATTTGTIAKGVMNTDVFTPMSNGVVLSTFPASTPASYTSSGGLDFVAIRLAVRSDDKTSGPLDTTNAKSLLEFRDGADLANFAN